MSRLAVLAAGAVFLAASTTAAWAEGPATQDDLQQSVQALKERNRDLERRLADLEGKMSSNPEAIKTQQDQIRAMVEDAMSKSKPQAGPAGWLDNLTFSGDMRLRYEYRDNTDTAARDKRGRVRLRFGFEKSWPTEDLKVGFRLATGETNDPTSTNQSFIGFQKYQVWGDRAYAQWTPKAVPGLSVTAGKMANPWETSDLVWDPDINPDGVWVRYNVPGLGSVTPFVGVGVFQLYASDSKRDSAMYAYDAGVRWQISKDVKLTSAVTFFNYTNLDSAYINGALSQTSDINKREPTGSNTRVGGHLVSNYNTIDFVSKLDFVAFNLPMSAFIDFAHNTDSENLSSKDLDGLAVGLKVGANKKKGDWSAWYVWKHLESDAVLAAFTESDFGWNTLTNRRGSQFGVAYNITDNMTAGVTLFITEPIKASNSTERFTLQADLVWKF
jgi:hypothetical protein